jgi:hypothetical protein
MKLGGRRLEAPAFGAGKYPLGPFTDGIKILREDCAAQLDKAFGDLRTDSSLPMPDVRGIAR